VTNYAEEAIKYDLSIFLQLAGILQALGSKVTLVIRGSRVLRSFDTLISEKVTENLELAGIDVKKQTWVTKQWEIV